MQFAPTRPPLINKPLIQRPDINIRIAESTPPRSHNTALEINIADIAHTVKKIQRY
jgi:hypothetical protein